MRKPPDSQRLHVLIQLREQAGLSQAEMARLCGLSGSTSRRSVANWELGESVPRRRHRQPFMRYLLDSLNLRDNPALFKEVWEILVEEWDWDPLTEEEWQAAAPVDDQPPAPYLVAEMGAAPTSERTHQAMSHQRTSRVGTSASRAWIMGSALLLALSLAAGIWWMVTPPHDGSEIYTPHNLGFEDPQPAPWRDNGGCGLDLVTDAAVAHDGEQYLHLIKESDQCLSLHHDKSVQPELNADHTFIVRLRSPDAAPRKGTVVLWQSTAPLDAPGHGVKDNSEKAAVDFVVDGRDWQCIEVSNHLQDAAYNVVRGEIFLDGPEGTDLLLDNAGFLEGDAAGCPPSTNLRLIDGENEFGPDYSAWEWASAECVVDYVAGEEPTADRGAYLAATRLTDGCYSMQQQVSTSVAQGQTIRGGIWAKTPDNRMRDLSVAVRSLDLGDERHRRFRAGPDWQCFEVPLETQRGGASRVQLEIYFDEPAATSPTYHLDGAFLTSDPGVGCPSSPLALRNRGFEREHTLLPWEWNGDCPFEVVADEQLAFEGGHFLAVQRADEGCVSLYQDLPLFADDQPALFTAGIWARTSDGARRSAVLRIKDANAPEHVTHVRFSPVHEQWHCFEATLQLPSLTDESVLYYELFPESTGEGAYYFDDAMLAVGERHVCPQTELGLFSLRTDSPTGRFYPGAALGIVFGVANRGSSDAQQEHLIQAWVSESPDGGPIAHTEIARIRVPALAAGHRHDNLRMDVPLPVLLQPDQDYFVVVDVDASAFVSGPEGIGRDSLGFNVIPCRGETLFCDVPADHWARVEIERWFEDGITSGCRTGTDPYLNRPFCPDTAVNRDMFAVFLLRHLYGTDFDPGQVDATVFTDVDGETRFAPWITALAGEDIELPSAACEADAGERRYCPDLALTRGELAMLLADVLAWPVDTVEPLTWHDVDAETPLAAVATFMWQAGLLDGEDPRCPSNEKQRSFCPDQPLYRDAAAFILARAFAGERE